MAFEWLEAKRHRVTPEREEQQNTVNLLRSIGAHVYVLGTVRRKGDHPGTMQTPGIGDLYTHLPPHPGACGGCLAFGAPTDVERCHECGYTQPRPAGLWTPLWIEMKRQGGRVRPEQKLFAERCQAAGVAHVTGTCDDVIRYLVQGGWLKAPSVATHHLSKP